MKATAGWSQTYGLCPVVCPASRDEGQLAGWLINCSRYQDMAAGGRRRYENRPADTISRAATAVLIMHCSVGRWRSSDKLFRSQSGSTIVLCSAADTNTLLALPKLKTELR